MQKQCPKQLDHAWANAMNGCSILHWSLDVHMVDDKCLVNTYDFIGSIVIYDSCKSLKNRCGCTEVSTWTRNHHYTFTFIHFCDCCINPSACTVAPALWGQH